jgi:phosphoribosylformimino-5-aminoimidazole carboxamide ribotide isomerase
MGFKIIPSIDLRSGQVVRLQQGDFQRQLTYDLDPVAVAKSFQADGATIMHIVDLDGAKEGRVMQDELIGQVADATELTIQAGGGIRTEDDIRRLIDAGVHRVVVGTAAFKNWRWFEKASQGEFANQLVLAIDAKSGMVATHGWTETSTVHALDVAKTVNDWPLAGLLYTDVAKDGMLQGPNVEATAELAAATNVPVIASGGVGNLDHIKGLLGNNIWGVILGRSLHDGKVKLKEAIEVVRMKAEG